MAAKEGVTFPGGVLRVVDRFMPARGMSPAERARYRFLVGGSLLGTLVAACSAVVTAYTGPWLSLVIIVLFGAGVLAILSAARQGTSLLVLNRLCLFQVGWFLTASCLMTRNMEWNQLAWLVLLPILSLMLTGDQPARNAVIPPVGTIWSAALLAVLLGAGIVAAHQLGWTADFFPASGPQDTVGRLVDFVLFTLSVTGLLWAYHVSMRSMETELQSLRETLSICAWCKRIRDEKEGWITMEQQLARNPKNTLTHGICPSCYASSFPEQPPRP